jgi:hypothetical protein
MNKLTTLGCPTHEWTSVLGLMGLATIVRAIYAISSEVSVVIQK